MPDVDHISTAKKNENFKLHYKELLMSAYKTT
jgi:hypothetical protein